jgi:arginine decarboxylase
LLQENKDFLTDQTKIFFGIKNVSGYSLGNFLLEENIEVELDNNKGVLAITGIGTTGKKLQKLYNAVIKSVNLRQEFSVEDICCPFIKPETVYTPNDAFYKNSKSIKLNDSIGQISKETIVLYPPGIPVLIAGELVQQEHINLIKYMDEIKVIVE